ncbi:nickel pincer cofactor biosynthesis protein LarC [Ruminococcus sp. 5_1_39BFAA]|uniref:nickel pincer cofactor biosynthesis protein LarC n=1 Tax=Ruminococcus sp. 5_1_39BFAA TaxID=457412 RepID=UPI0035665205
MGKTLYLECYSGISGDMAVAALLDLGADRQVLNDVLKSLPVQGFDIQTKQVIKSGISACDFEVVLDAAHENHDHDMDYLHGHEHQHCCSHEEPNGEKDHHGHVNYHGEKHHHGAEESHEAEHHHSHEKSHHHEHRGMKEIREIINKAAMTPRARGTALRIFEILAEAESKAHQVPVEEVHFHEVGAVDSIVDIISAAVCLDNLDITEAVIPVLCEGTGTVRCQHGILPIPVPAVANIVSAHGMAMNITAVQGELVTPTGAAIAAAIRTSEKLPKNFSIEKIGVGAGKRQYECPGILRAMIIQDKSVGTDRIVKLETNVDDCTGENLGYVMEQLFAAGARDVHYTPVFMKKNRPAWLLTVICGREKVKELEEIIFRETTTIGIRKAEMERTVLKREIRKIETSLGTAEVKVCDLGGEKKFYPEYESLIKICRETGVSYQEAYRLAVEACCCQE